MNEEMTRRFAYLPVTTTERADAHGRVRDGAAAYAEVLDKLTYSREKALAITNLEQAMFWANAAIARADPTA